VAAYVNLLKGLSATLCLSNIRHIKRNICSGWKGCCLQIRFFCGGYGVQLLLLLCSGYGIPKKSCFDS